MSEKRYRKIHLCLDIQGGINNAKMLKGAITIDNGKRLNTVKEVRDFLRGHDVIEESEGTE